MTESRHCGRNLVILSTAMLVLLVIATDIVAFVYMYLPMRYKGNDNIIPTIKCHKISMIREIYQHDHYWVLKNSIRAEETEPKCEQITLTMQGTYEEIYKLKYLFYEGLHRGPVSFAVNIPTAEHLNRTLTAIADVRNCVWVRQQNLTYIYYIRKYVTFHLYFYMENMPLATWQQDFEAFVYNGMQCGKNTTKKPLMEDETIELYRRVHPEIVGRNIAQLAANTKFVLRSDPDTYPSANLNEMWIREYSLLPTLSASNRSKLVFRLPTFIISQMHIGSNVARTNAEHFVRMLDKDSEPFTSGNWAAYDSLEWLLTKTNATHTIHFLPDHFHKELLQSYSYFISARDGPLLDDRMGCTVEQSEILRLFEMMLQNSTFAVPHLIFVLHNYIGNPDETITRKIDINDKVLLDYIHMFH